MALRGIAYGVGVGPGDPELVTLKAVRLIRENEIIALSGSNPKETTAYRIAVQAVPELAEKKLLGLPSLMTMDARTREEGHRQSAELIESYLEQGQNVVYLTLGDSTVYCTFTYIQHLLEMDGYETELVNGIPSFCAAASRLNIPLAEWNEAIHILPGMHLDQAVSLPSDGTIVVMKSASRLQVVKSRLQETGLSVQAVEKCGMPDEQLYHCTEEIPDDAGYFTLIIAKENIANDGEV